MPRQPPKNNNHNDDNRRKDANSHNSPNDTPVSLAALILQPFISVYRFFVLALHFKFQKYCTVHSRKKSRKQGRGESQHTNTQQTSSWRGLSHGLPSRLSRTIWMRWFRLILRLAWIQDEGTALWLLRPGGWRGRSAARTWGRARGPSSFARPWVFFFLSGGIFCPFSSMLFFSEIVMLVFDLRICWLW